MRTLSLETQYQPVHYVSARQQPGMLSATTIIARTSGSASALVAELRTAVRTVDPQARGITMTVEEMVQNLTRERRQATSVLAGLAALALTLAGIGIYGVLAYTVAQRIREIGIRLALGATVQRVVRQTIGELGIPVVAGVALGLVCARAASRALSSLVFGITPTDPLVLGSAAVVILMLASIAAYVPARRAARVDPNIALRHG
jgi:ABC-type antimicrobial peptide transport system permease subunit